MGHLLKKAWICSKLHWSSLSFSFQGLLILHLEYPYVPKIPCTPLYLLSSRDSWAATCTNQQAFFCPESYQKQHPFRQLMSGAEKYNYICYLLHQIIIKCAVPLLTNGRGHKFFTWQCTTLPEPRSLDPQKPLKLQGLAFCTNIWVLYGNIWIPSPCNLGPGNMMSSNSITVISSGLNI